MSLTTEPPVQPTSLTFTDLVRQALRLYPDVQRLGLESPLAAPYLLSAYWAGAATDPRARGRALQQLLLEAIEQLPDDEQHYSRTILLRRFVQEQSVVKVQQALHIGKTRFHELQNLALEQVEEVLRRRLKPSLRLETPVVVAKVIGYEREIHQCEEALRTGKSVALIGPSGVGKTTVGSAVAARLAPQPLFWFTIRPGLHDQPYSLLFSLAHFLQNHGVADLWLQLLADAGKTEHTLAVSLLRHGLSQLPGPRAVLCFDEIDLLRPTESENHAIFMTLLEALQPHAALLLIGQQVLARADFYLEIKGLPATHLPTWLQQTNLHLTAAQQQQLYRHTQGNPRLLELMAILYASDATPAALDDELAHAPSVEALFTRIWRRLATAEQEILLTLALYRQPAPQDHWSSTQARYALDQLQQRRLLQHDGRGGLLLLPLYRKLLYGLLPPALRTQLHEQVAASYVLRGAMTEAAYHYVQAGQVAQAIWLWRTHQQQEINQGQAATALALWQELPLDTLAQPEREALVLLRGQLALVTGNQQRAQQELTAILWRTPLLALEAQQLSGDIATERSTLDTALTAYRQGLQIAETLVEARLTHLHKDIGWAQMRMQELTLAWREALLARYEAENFQGYVQARLGNFPEAERYYQAALAQATAMHHAGGQAKTANNLAQLCAYQGRYREAADYWQQACAYYEQAGKVTAVAMVKANLATMQQLAGESATAVITATAALALFEQFDQVWGQAFALQTLAEAHLSLGELAAAEAFAQRVVQTEETDRLPDGLRVLGEVFMQRGAYSEALTWLQESIRLAEQQQDRYLAAYGYRALGQLYAAQQNRAQAAAHFQQATHLFTALGLTNEIAKTADLWPGGN